MTNDVVLDWANFKSILIIGKDLKYQHINSNQGSILVLATDSGYFYSSKISGADLLDFNTNYLDGSNKRITPSVNSGGAMLTTTAVEAPIGTNPFNIVRQSEMNNSDDAFQSILLGETMTIQRLTASGASSVEGSVVELYEDPAGDLSNLVFIDDIVVNGSSFSQNLIHTIVGSATMRLLMRRLRLDGSKRRLKGRVEGFIE